MRIYYDFDMNEEKQIKYIIEEFDKYTSDTKNITYRIFLIL